jgi:hypothetical protein
MGSSRSDGRHLFAVSSATSHFQGDQTLGSPTRMSVGHCGRYSAAHSDAFCRVLLKRMGRREIIEAGRVMPSHTGDRGNESRGGRRNRARSEPGHISRDSVKRSGKGWGRGILPGARSGCALPQGKNPTSSAQDVGGDPGSGRTRPRARLLLQGASTTTASVSRAGIRIAGAKPESGAIIRMAAGGQGEPHRHRVRTLGKQARDTVFRTNSKCFQSFDSDVEVFLQTRGAERAAARSSE